MNWRDRTADQKADAVRDLLGEGLSYTEIAAALKAPSRCAIAGVAYRRRLESVRRWGVNKDRPKKENRAVTKEKAVRARRKVKPHAGLTAYVALGEPEPATSLKPGTWTPLPGSTPVSLTKRTGCAWPCDMPDGRTLFCNLPPKEGRSWCEHHFAMGNRPVVVGTKKRVAPKLLKGLTS